MPINFEVIDNLKQQIVDANERTVAKTILARAKELIPVEEGVARDSGEVVTEGNTSYISFGRDDDGSELHAPSNEYIERLHEDVEMSHPDGGQAKFVEAAADEYNGTYADEVALEIKL